MIRIDNSEEYIERGCTGLYIYGFCCTKAPLGPTKQQCTECWKEKVQQKIIKNTK